VKLSKNIKNAAAAIAVIVTATLPTASIAHHSFAMYDQTTTRTLTGKLTRFIPGANHAQFFFELLDASGTAAVDASGRPVVWGVEMGPAAALAREGITTASFELGTIFTVELHPLRDGRTFGVLNRTDERIVRCGMQMPTGGCTEETGRVYADLGN
jgi:hypothetical protein